MVTLVNGKLYWCWHDATDDDRLRECCDAMI